jgi:hypothetical protein
VLLVTGCCTLLADLVYAVNIPRLLHIYFPGPDSSLSIMRFHLSTCFYVTLASGSINLSMFNILPLLGLLAVGFGGLLYVLETRSLYRLSTFLCEEVEEYALVLKCRQELIELETSSPSSGFNSRSLTSSASSLNS